MGLDAGKFGSAKISQFTVHSIKPSPDKTTGHLSVVSSISVCLLSSVVIPCDNNLNHGHIQTPKLPHFNQKRLLFCPLLGVQRLIRSSISAPRKLSLNPVLRAPGGQARGILIYLGNCVSPNSRLEMGYVIKCFQHFNYIQSRRSMFRILK